MMKKNKTKVDLTLECQVTQRSAAPVRKVRMGKWDSVKLEFSLDLSGTNFIVARDSAEFRREVKDRISERIDELFDAVEIV
jgi:hypothetical protein